MDEKMCARCETVKPASAFWKCKRNGLQSYCKDCSMAYEKQRYPAGTPKPGKRARELRQKYDLTEAEYSAMFERQGGRCLICDVKKGRLDVDHDHETGQVRGLLCHRCNTAIGLFGDDPNRMIVAAAYVLQTQSVLTGVGE